MSSQNAEERRKSMEASTLEKLAMEEKKREEVSKIMFVLLRKEDLFLKCDGLLAFN